MSGYNGDWAVTLPGYGMSPAQADMFQQQMAERHAERADAMAERNRLFNERQQDRNEAFRSNMFGNILKQDPNAPYTQLSHLDNYFKGKLSDLLNKYSTDPTLTKLPNDVWSAKFQQDAMPILTAHKNSIDTANSAVNQVNQLALKDKSLNKEALQSDALNRIASDMFNPDGTLNTNVGNRDYVGDLYNNDVNGKYVAADAKAAYPKKIEDAPRVPYFAHRPMGDNNYLNYQGNLHPLEVPSEMPDNNRQVKGDVKLNLVNDTVTLPNGKVVPKIRDREGNYYDSIPEDKMSLFEGNPQDKRVFNSIVADLAPSYKAKGLSDDEIRRIAAYTIAKNHVKSDFRVNPEHDASPRNVINLGKEVPTQDIYTPLNQLMKYYPKGMSLNLAPPEVRDYFMESAKKAGYTKDAVGGDLSAKNFAVKQNTDGTYDLKVIDGNAVPIAHVGTYDKSTMNLGVAKGKERGENLKQQNKNAPSQFKTQMPNALTPSKTGLLDGLH